ncbi:MAG TPA: glycosyltransferase family A protein [Thermodesulfobacteriota bacterium]|nr:glycosyltransferase family A protein [Thermodesulfobacteriota bacterium]
MSEAPLISCLCITRGRTKLLGRAVQSFRDQTYPNKELVLLYESGDGETAEYIRTLEDLDLKLVEIPSSEEFNLGRLRNRSIRECRGEYFCQWDDDDWSHRDRLSFQMGVIKASGMPACLLFHWLMYDDRTGKAYLSNRRPWEGSLLCRKSLLGGDLIYEEIARHEDTRLVTELFRRSLVFPVMMPKLYIYVYHGGNLCTREHWEKIFRASTELSAESTSIIRGILEGSYSGEEASRLLDGIER